MTANTSFDDDRRSGMDYILTIEEIEQYREQGYLVIENVLSESEISEIDPWFEYFIAGKHRGMERDLCDMSQPRNVPFEQYQLVNAMLPSIYQPKLANCSYEQIAFLITKQLYGAEGVQKDYDQFLAKKPGFEGAKFEMHQDLGYWPKTPSTWTATYSLALNDSDIENGCLQVVPGSNKETMLREHLPIALTQQQVKNQANLNEFNPLGIQVANEEKILFLPVKRGSMTIHDERIIHGSAGNNSKRWRKTYVMAFREKETIQRERQLGFTHSHNDSLDWKKVLT